MEVIIRDATIGDAAFVAWIVFTALGPETVTAESVSVCSRSDTLYSWTNTRIIEVDGIVAGGLISYDGGFYSAARQRTWRAFWTSDDPVVLDNVAAECAPEDYYLDSLAVKPEFRGLGLGKRLIHDGIDIARRRGFQTVSLIAEESRERLVRHYEGLGFKIYGRMDFFGHDYLKMRLDVDK